MRLIIHATNVHHGGGKALLSSLLSAIPPDLDAVALLDSRMELPSSVNNNLKIKFVKPSVFQRLFAERWLARNVQRQDMVLCFGNMPPLFKLLGHVTVFVQNRYLVEKFSLKSFPIKARIRLSIEYLLLRWLLVNADEFVVQTPSMKTAFLSSCRIVKQSVHIRPFVSESFDCKRTANHQYNLHGHKQYDFVYVASGEPHKNHRQLVVAWCLLAKQGVFPSLCLTLNKDESMQLCDWIEVQKLKYGLKLENVGFLPHDQILQLYTRAMALIYPSRFESFGLPLIEASQAGLPVLAPELDYVRDVLDPEQSFDSDSSVSIARAVRRYLKIDEPSLQLLDAAKFLQLLLKRYG